MAVSGEPRVYRMLDTESYRKKFGRVRKDHSSGSFFTEFRSKNSAYIEARVNAILTPEQRAKPIHELIRDHPGVVEKVVESVKGALNLMGHGEEAEEYGRHITSQAGEIAKMPAEETGSKGSAAMAGVPERAEDGRKVYGVLSKALEESTGSGNLTEIVSRQMDRHIEEIPDSSSYINFHEIDVKDLTEGDFRAIGARMETVVDMVAKALEIYDSGEVAQKFRKIVAESEK